MINTKPSTVTTWTYVRIAPLCERLQCQSRRSWHKLEQLRLQKQITLPCCTHECSTGNKALDTNMHPQAVQNREQDKRLKQLRVQKHLTLLMHSAIGANHHEHSEDSHGGLILTSHGFSALKDALGIPYSCQLKRRTTYNDQKGYVRRFETSNGGTHQRNQEVGTSLHITGLHHTEELGRPCEPPSVMQLRTQRYSIASENVNDRSGSMLLVASPQLCQKSQGRHSLSTLHFRRLFHSSSFLQRETSQRYT